MVDFLQTSFYIIVIYKIVHGSVMGDDFPKLIVTTPENVGFTATAGEHLPFRAQKRTGKT